MVAKDTGAGPTDMVEQAMNRVLQAEREAEQAIADCEQQARQILQAAEQRVKRIADRTDERITLLQLRLAQKIKAHIDALERADRRSQREPSLYDPGAAELASVVQEVAADLTGNTHSRESRQEKAGSE